MASTLPASVEKGSEAGTRVAQAAAVFAIFCALVPLAGWIFAVPELRRFGYISKDLFPLSAVGYVGLGAALMAIISLRSHYGLALLAVPAAIGATALFEHATNRTTGIDLLLFRDAVANTQAAVPGRPGYITAVSFLALPAAIALSAVGSRRAGAAVALLASICLAFAVLSLALVTLFVTDYQDPIGLATAPVPAALATMALGTGLLAWRPESGWAGLLAMSGTGRSSYRIVFPLIILAPIGTSLAGLALVQNGAADTIQAVVLATAVDVLAFSALLFWTTSRMVGDRSALEEISRALDSAPIAITDEAGVITHWSAGCEDLYGYDAGEAIGRTKRELLRSRPVSHAVASGRDPAGETTEEWIEQRRDGSEIHVIERARPLRLHGRDPVVVLGITDISDRIAMEQELRLSRTRVEMAVEAHEVGIFEWDVRTGALSWSPGSEQRLGLTSGSLSSYESWAALIDPYDLKSVETTLAEATDRREPRFSFYYRFRKPNGQVRAVEGSARCFYDEDGALRRCVGAMIDVTRRDERESMLQASEAQLRSVLDTVPDAMVVVDERGRVQSFSRAAEELLGYTADQVIGSEFERLVPEALPAQGNGYARLFGEGGNQRETRGRLLQAVHASGDEIPIELRLGVARGGSRRQFTAFLRDRRSHLESEERLNRLRDDLTHVARLSAMGELAAGLAHELNQPLAASVNFLATAEMLISANGDTVRVGELIAMAGSQNKRAGDIIRRLRAFVSRQEPEVRAEPIEETIRDAVTLVVAGHSQTGLEVEYRLDPEARLMFADRVQVQQVLVNLVRNAAEAVSSSPRNGRAARIEIGSRHRGAEMVEIWVRDHGPGIAPEILEQMYTPFLSTKGGGGMGIGLTICRRIVEAHGGTMSAENMPDGGACFRFTLPLINEREIEDA